MTDNQAPPNTRTHGDQHEAVPEEWVCGADVPTPNTVDGPPGA